MKILSLIRSNEWWEHKLPMLLAIGYATAAGRDASVYDIAPALIKVLLAIMTGAIYVSLVNDLADIKEDLASGKRNRMSGLKPWQRSALLLLSILLGVAAGIFFVHDIMSLCWYTAAWLVFTLYSVPPFRLKKRGLWGVAADASGAHLFPGLLMLSATAHALQLHVGWVWPVAVAIWSLAYGLRGILWHQFADRENDLLVGIGTFATKYAPATFRRYIALFLLPELLSLLVMLCWMGLILPVTAMLIYLIIAVGYRARMRLQIIAIVPPQDQPYHVFMSSYYMVLLPLSVLVTAALADPRAWWVLAVHLLLFPRHTLRLLRDVLLMLRIINK